MHISLMWLAIGIITSGSLIAQTPGAAVRLFDGRSLTGWNTVGDANWTVTNGEIQATTGTGFLVTPASYADFEVTAELWVDADANSGVFIRCADRIAITADNCYEVNVFDKRPDPAYRTGAIVNIAKPAAVVNAAGQWNTLRITARGSRLTVVLNGVTTVDVQDAKLVQGAIALQRSAGVVKFRSVLLRPL